MRLGILCADRVVPELSAVYGGYPQMFRRILLAVDKTLDIVDFDVTDKVPEVVDCDVYLITGSKHSVYEPLPWVENLVAFLGSVLAQNKIVIGICFGHQLMAHYFGGRVAKAPQGWGVGTHCSEVVADCGWMTGPVAGPKLEHITLLCSHQDQVVSLPADAQVFLASPFCPVGGFVLGEQIITVQGHPEFSTGYAAGLMQRRRQAMGEDVYQKGMASLGQPTDAQALVGWLLNFARGDFH